MTTERSETLWQGVVAGILGYVAVALVVSLIDLSLGRSFFYTVALLGEHLFYGLSDPAQVVVWPGAVFAYNGLHLVAFIFLGIVAAWLALLSEKGPELWYLAAILYMLVFLHAFGAVLLMTEDIRAAVPAWVIVVATVVGGAVMGGYLLAVRPRLRDEMRTWHELPGDAGTA